MSDKVDSMDATEEAELVSKARLGERPALERLLSVHQHRVYRTALSLVGGDADSAAEVAQDVLISAAQHIDRFRGESRFATWLYRITVNKVRNHQVAASRRSARVVSLDAPQMGEDGSSAPREMAASQRSVSSAVADGESVAILHQRIAQLPDEFRAAVVLRFVEDRSCEEIAKILSIPEGTVKSRIHRGRAELRRLMADVLGKEGHAS